MNVVERLLCYRTRANDGAGDVNQRVRWASTRGGLEWRPLPGGWLVRRVSSEAEREQSLGSLESGASFLASF